jgi:hypothetical protein
MSTESHLSQSRNSYGVTKFNDKNSLGWVYNLKQVLEEHEVWSIVNEEETAPRQLCQSCSVPDVNQSRRLLAESGDQVWILDMAQDRIRNGSRGAIYRDKQRCIRLQRCGIKMESDLYVSNHCFASDDIGTWRKGSNRRESTNTWWSHESGLLEKHYIRNANICANHGLLAIRYAIQ